MYLSIYLSISISISISIYIYRSIDLSIYLPFYISTHDIFILSHRPSSLAPPRSHLPTASALAVTGFFSGGRRHLGSDRVGIDGAGHAWNRTEGSCLSRPRRADVAAAALMMERGCAPYRACRSGLAVAVLHMVPSSASACTSTATTAGSQAGKMTRGDSRASPV